MSLLTVKPWRYLFLSRFENLCYSTILKLRLLLEIFLFEFFV